MEGLVVLVPYYSSDSFTIVTYLSKFSGDLLQEFKIIFSVRPRDNEFVPIEAIFSLAQRYNISLAWRFFLLIFSLLGGRFRVNVVDQSPFLQKFMYAYNRARVSRQTSSGLGGVHILILSDFDDIIAVLFVQLLMFLEFNIILHRKIPTIVARMPFFILNHSGRAFFSI